jgi:hypothetical protein
MAWQHISPEVTVKGSRSAVYPVQGTGLMMIRCGMAVKRMGKLGVSVRKMRALTVEMETVTLTGKGRWNWTCFVFKCTKLIVKYFSKQML